MLKEQIIQKISNIYMHILVLAVLVLDRKSFYTTVILNYKVTFIIFLILVIPLIIYVIFKDGINKKMLLAFSLFLLTMFIPQIIKADYQIYIVSSAVYMTAIFLIISIYPLKKILNTINNLIIFMSGYSLFIYFIVHKIMYYIGIQGPIIANSLGFKLYNYLLCFLPVSGSNRNYGIYSEPGVFQIYILLALIITIYTKCKYKKIKVAILSVTMLTTGSIAGIAVEALLLGVIFINSYLKKRNIQLTMSKSKVVKYLIAFFILFVISIGVLSTETNEIIKLKEETVDKLINRDNMSNISRTESLIKVSKAFILSPLYGNNFAKIMDIPKYGNTNTITTVYAVFGIVFGTMNMFLIYYFVKIFTKDKILIMGIFLAIILALSTQFIFGTMLYAIIVICGLKKYILKEDIDNENTLVS